jgi:hypothetical protein
LSDCLKGKAGGESHVEEEQAHQVLQLGPPVHNRDYQDNLRVQSMITVVDCLKGEAGSESHVEEKQAHQVLQLGPPVHNMDYQDNLQVQQVQPMRRVD